MVYEFTQPFVVNSTKARSEREQADPTLLHEAIASDNCLVQQPQAAEGVENVLGLGIDGPATVTLTSPWASR